METKELIIFGQTTVEKCVLANILASPTHMKPCRLFHPMILNNNSITIRSVLPTHMEHTPLKLFIVPQNDCEQYIEFLQKLKSYQKRFIFYVLNSTRTHDYDPIREVRTLMTNIGTYNTRYIPVVYRDSEHLHEPITEQETAFLKRFPDTHFHAPVIHKNAYQIYKHYMLFQYLQYACKHEGPGCFRNYPPQDYLCPESQSHAMPPLQKQDIVEQEKLSINTHLSDNSLGLSTLPQSAFQETGNTEEKDTPTKSRPTSIKPDRELEDYNLNNGSTQELHVTTSKNPEQEKLPINTLLSDNSLGPSTSPQSAFQKTGNTEEKDTPTKSRPTSIKPDRELEDYNRNNASTQELTTSKNHIRIMVMGPKGAGKTTLIKRLKLESSGYSSYCPTEGINIEETIIRCREVNDGELEWEVTENERKCKTKYRENQSPAIIGNISVTETSSARFSDCVSGQRVSSEIGKQSGDGERSHTSLSRNDDESVTVDSPCENVSRSDDEYADNEVLLQSTDTDLSIDIEQEGRICEEESLIKEEQKENATVPWTYCSIWDIGGNAAYHSAHHMFLPSSGVYILVADLSKDLDETSGEGMFRMTEAESLKFWFTSIKQQSDSSQICLVATHKDRISDSSVLDQVLTKLFGEVPTKLQRFVLDNTSIQTEDNQDDFHRLQEFIEHSAYILIDGYTQDGWTEINQYVQRNVQSGVCVRDLNTMLEHLCLSETTILSFLHYQHSRGNLHFFLKKSACLNEERIGNGDGSENDMNDKKLQTPIFLDPSVLIQFVNLILKRRLKEDFVLSLRIERCKVNYFPEGVFDDEYISEMLNMPGNEVLLANKDIIIKQLLALHIIFTFKEGENLFIFMPCLLRQQPQDHIFDCFEEALEKSSTLVIRFTTFCASQIVFQELVATLHQHYTPRVQMLNNVERSQIYCGYVSFMLLPTGLQQMQIYWKANEIHFKISNFDGAISFKDNVTDKDVTHGQTALDTTLDCLNEVLISNRNSPDYKLMVICPKHFIPPTMAPLDILLAKGGYLCKSEIPHMMTKEHVLQFWISPGLITQRPAIPEIERPTEKQLARLALFLRMDSYLACVLKLEDAYYEASNVSNRYKDNKEMQRLVCLLKWKQQKGTEATFMLLRKRLEKSIWRSEGDWISKVVSGNTTTGKYELEKDILHKSPSDYSLAFCIAKYILPAQVHFFFIELGISYATVEQARSEQHENGFNMHQLFRKWKETKSKEATYMTILDAADWVGIDATDMLHEIKGRVNDL